ncbi:hypothetical protein SteCoe_17169 [Stentor coeruleus]|uniref:Uncharacterized protein n=1 Tax=Stentor coeruleus TaxID=5963 RepID=A0A1R2BZK4_9CILI|nr:hypothetical protein SteCoe_17169 [Stentor coeruleus]
MGKCLSKEAKLAKISRLTLQEYIENIKRATSQRRMTLVLFQNLSNLVDHVEMEKAEVVDNIIEQKQFIKIIKETVDINSSKIYSEYHRYFNARKAFRSNTEYLKDYIDTIISQVSSLNINIKRFPYKLSTKYLITESVYAKSLQYYSSSRKINKVLRKSMIQAFKNREKWSESVQKDQAIDIIKFMLEYWKKLFRKNDIENFSELIQAKGFEGECIMMEFKVNECDAFLGLDDLGFYSKTHIDESVEEFQKVYFGYMNRAVSKLDTSINCKDFGSFGLLKLKEMQSYI